MLPMMVNLASADTPIRPVRVAICGRTYSVDTAEKAIVTAQDAWLAGIEPVNDWIAVECELLAALEHHEIGELRRAVSHFKRLTRGNFRSVR
ncbi:hypothetical protein [Microbaculum marinum]|uniref:Uncharacterized protein n=1 Tax=Microbaculum marinum TaxID=1764581 RepID=A0AAW9RYG9_9HYPH